MTEFSLTPDGKNRLFRLNMQILADVFTEHYQNVTFYAQNDRPCLEGIRLYKKGKNPNFRYVYLIQGKDVDQSFLEYRDIDFITVGRTDIACFHQSCAVIELTDNADFLDTFELVQETFAKYRQWDRHLHYALDSEHPLDEMLLASLEIFGNPMFIHDTDFYILSCPRYVQGMTVWERDSRTGRNMVPLSLIHDFKADTEYLETLSKTSPDLFSAEQRGYRILYVNLWNNSRYEGRICVDEIQSEIQDGNYLALQYLGQAIELAIKHKSLFHLSMGNDMDRFFNEYLDGTIGDTQRILNYLYFLHWKQNDRYLCLRLETEQRDINMLSAAATLGHIQAQIPSGHAFLYRQSIAVVVNLSYAHSTSSEVISSLAVLMREGLLKMGASSEIHDFMLVPQGYIQASAALDLGRKSESMIWCYRFDDYLLEYLLKKGREEIPPQLLCSGKLLLLKKYDDKNKTDLYTTVKVYLELERNILQTAKELYIHRSTLFYRLERIRKIAGIDFEDSRERLVLRLSFYILEQKLET